jgi:CheY-like chemotaxis protein
MSKKLNCIMLVDDNRDDNVFHERVIRKNNISTLVLTELSGMAALNYLEEKKFHEKAHPDLIFLDINMPGMNGWEFLEEYNKLSKEFQSKIVVVMLTTSANPDDKAKAKALDVLSDFKTKPLTDEMLNWIIEKYF